MPAPRTPRRRPGAGRPALEVQPIPVGVIATSQRNPRRKLTGIAELAESIRASGLLQPIVVRPAGKGYELLAGHRRLEAVRQLGWSHVPAVVRPVSEADAYLLTLIENLQREDLSPREEANALELLVRERGWSTRQVAAAIHRSQAFVSKRLRVFEDPVLAPAVLANQVSLSAAEELLAAPEPRRRELLSQAIQQRWSKAQVRRAARHRPARATARHRGRQPGLARRVRDLRFELRDIELDQLLEADRRELRLLFRELAMLARTRPGKGRQQRIFPPLPSGGS